MEEHLTKKQMKQALIDAGCPEDLIVKIGQDIQLWWKTGWIQEILIAQKQAGIREVVEDVVKELNNHHLTTPKRQILERVEACIGGWEVRLKEWGVDKPRK